ncbi:MAG TPA: hypothetical protein VFE78_21905 [Gemmataceae bacterium]|jgi:(1->4)-alpha-D-glucan 1-alpha-D-glucosylmutase|nr:hypothetical protein [Gemmataceae bacterium]
MAGVADPAPHILYQTLLGVWPEGRPAGEALAAPRRRVADYMRKATNEAKVHASWVNPNTEYDAAVRDFVCRLLPDADEGPFLTDFLALQRRVAFSGNFNSLAQVLLKFTCRACPTSTAGPNCGTSA